MRLTLLTFAIFVLPLRLCAAADIDGDGLLDLIDMPGFDSNASGYVGFYGLGIEDLDGAGQLTGATLLNLGANLISSIENGDLGGLTHLQELELNENRIGSIESAAFHGLNNLQRLNLVGNQISSTEVDFGGLPNLEVLWLRHNQIKSIESGDFGGLSTLRQLDLSHNQITSLERGDFDGVPNLRGWFWLHNNQITTIESGTFEGLTSVDFLFLNGNRITSVENGDFDGLTELRSLDLYGNQIVSIESGGFDGLSNLDFLDLHDNKITSIESEDFDGLANLSALELQDNMIASIEKGSFSGLTNLRTLNLRGNHISTLNLAGAAFEELNRCFLPIREMLSFRAGFCIDPDVSSLILDRARLSAHSLDAIVGETQFITDVSLEGLEFTDDNPSGLSALLEVGTLTTVTVDSYLYRLYSDEFNAFAAVEDHVLIVVAPDCNENERLDAADLSCVSSIRERNHVLAALDSLAGDLDGNGAVDFEDFAKLAANFGTNLANYDDGNVDLQNGVNFGDFLILARNFGKTPGDVAAVPEPRPSTISIVLLAIIGGLRRTAQERFGIQGELQGAWARNRS